jgi:uncharacterized protein (TIGR02246 family)
MRSVITVSLVTAMVSSAAAQSDQDARRAGEDILKAYNQGLLQRDAKALAALYAEDAVIFSTSGPIAGRPAIEKAFAETFKQYRPNPSNLERVAAIGNDVIVTGGSWSGTYPGVGMPVHLKGYWSATDVRDGSTWKIRTETWNVAADGTAGGYFFQPAQVSR